MGPVRVRALANAESSLRLRRTFVLTTASSLRTFELIELWAGVGHNYVQQVELFASTLY